MTPGNFEYHRPQTVDEAVALLGQYGEDARVLAGGHTLIPMMKLRLASPEHIIDIGNIDEIRGIKVGNGTIAIGAATTQAEALASDVLGDKCPLLGEAILVIADPQVRNCGTIGGNVANGDPGNDLPAVMIALGARYGLTSAKGTREVAAAAFCRGTFDTVLEPGEILTEIRIPAPPGGHGYAYAKMKRKVGDFATAATAVILEIDGGTCARASVALTNLGPAPIEAAGVAETLTGAAIDDAAIDAAGRRAADIADPVGDMHGPPEFRKRMAGEMTRRAIRAALARAKGG